MPRGRPKKEEGHRVPINLSFDPPVMERLDAASKRLKKPKSRIVEEAVTKHLDKLDKKPAV